MGDSRGSLAEAIHSVHSQSGAGVDGGGVYTLRSREASTVGVAAVRASTTKAMESIKDVGIDSETGSVDSRDIKKKQV